MTAALEGRTVPELNAVLRTLRGAREAYEKAIRRIERNRDRAAIALRVLLQDHLRIAESLRREIRRLGGAPDESVGAWGLWAMAKEGLAVLIGDVAAVKALRGDEEHGLAVVRTAARNVSEDRARRLVNDSVIPSLQQHLELLAGMLRPI